MNHGDSIQLIRFAGALIFVLGLMLGLSYVLRRVNNLQPVRRARQRRLSVVEILPVDGKRRLVLVRRDNREHLLMLGPEGETLIESGIESPQDAVTDDPSILPPSTPL